MKVTEFKITKNIKGPLLQCGSIRVVCMYGVLCGDVSWTQSLRFGYKTNRLMVYREMYIVCVCIVTIWALKC